MPNLHIEMKLPMIGMLVVVSPDIKTTKAPTVELCFVYNLRTVPRVYGRASESSSVILGPFFFMDLESVCLHIRGLELRISPSFQI